jgi:hypothetical protein
LFLKNGAGGVHDQLWQKIPVEEMAETINMMMCRAASAVWRAKL